MTSLLILAILNALSIRSSSRSTRGPTMIAAYTLKRFLPQVFLDAVTQNISSMDCPAIGIGHVTQRIIGAISLTFPWFMDIIRIHRLTSCHRVHRNPIHLLRT